MSDRIRQFSTDLNNTFSENLSKIKNQFNNEYDWPEFDPLRDEIAKCLICDLCQASITLTNHLIENFFKTILIYNELSYNKNSKDTLIRSYVDKYDGLDLSNTLGLAIRKGIIKKDQWKLLE